MNFKTNLSRCAILSRSLHLFRKCGVGNGSCLKLLVVGYWASKKNLIIAALLRHRELALGLELTKEGLNSSRKVISSVWSCRYPTDTKFIVLWSWWEFHFLCPLDIELENLFLSSAWIGYLEPFDLLPSPWPLIYPILISILRGISSTSSGAAIFKDWCKSFHKMEDPEKRNSLLLLLLEQQRKKFCKLPTYRDKLNLLQATWA